MIYSIIVTYNPKLSVLNRLLSCIRPQVDVVLIIDNASGSTFTADFAAIIKDYTDCFFICNDSNLGIAAALMMGVAVAEKGGADFVLFLDHDSCPAPDMVSQLLSSYERLTASGESVAAVGPAYKDVKGLTESPFVQLVGSRLQRVLCQPDEVVLVDHLISSGSLVPTSVLRNVGGMKVCLFIDYVDIEWCLRAKSNGYNLFGVGAAYMSHDLGENVYYFLGREFPVHSPIRYYYILRNGIWLLRQPCATWQRKFSEARRLVILYILASLFIGKSSQNFIMMTRGIWHALIGRMGKLKER